MIQIKGLQPKSLQTWRQSKQAAEGIMAQSTIIVRLQSLFRRPRHWLHAASNGGAGPERDGCDIDRLTKDVEESLADMPFITRTDAGPSSLLPERLRLLGLSRAYIELADMETFGRLREHCRTCPSCRRCARDLAHGDVAAGMEDYCANAVLLDGLVIDKFRG